MNPYADPQPPPVHGHMAPLQWPPLQKLQVTETPEGFAVAPRHASAGLWIEAIVWCVGFVALGICIVFGGDVLRVVGALGLAAIGIRALVRVVRAALAGTTRKLRLLLRVPRPSLAGPWEAVPLDEVARVFVGTRQRLTGLLAVTFSGKECWLVDFDPANADEYEALAAWLQASFHLGS